MLTRSNQSALFSTVLIVALGAIASQFSAGCSQCMALCLSAVTAKGPVAVGVADKPELTVKLCYGDTCETAQLTVDDAGTASCDSTQLRCTLTERADGKSDLEVNMPLHELSDLSADEEVTVHVQRAGTDEVLVDEKPEIDNVEENELCGQHCEGATASWGG